MYILSLLTKCENLQIIAKEVESVWKLILEGFEWDSIDQLRNRINLKNYLFYEICSDNYLIDNLIAIIGVIQFSDEGCFDSESRIKSKYVANAIFGSILSIGVKSSLDKMLILTGLKEPL